MTAFMRPRLRSEISCGHSFDDPNEGTSARTRPLSYDEIIRGRKAKKDLEASKEEAHNVEHSGDGATAEKLDHGSRDANPVARKHYRKHDSHGESNNKGSENVEKQSKRKHKKDTRTSTESFKANKQGHVSSQFNVESLDMDSLSKHKHEKDMRTCTESLKADRQEHVSGRFNVDLDDSRYKRKPEKDTRTSTESSQADRQEHATGRFNMEHLDDSRPNPKHEKDTRSSEFLKADRQGHVSGKLNVESVDMDSRSKHKREKDTRTISESLKADRQWHVSGKLNVESHDTDFRSKHKHEKDVRNRTEALKTNRRDHLGGKFDERHLDFDSRAEQQHEKDVRSSSELANNDGRRQTSGRIKEETLDMNARTKYRHEKDLKNSAEVLKYDWRGHVRGREAEESCDLKNRSKHQQEKDVRINTKGFTSDRRGHVSSKQDERLKDSGKYDYGIKNHRDPKPLDRYLDRSEGTLEKENKRKDRAGDDEKIRIRDPIKKHDSGRRRDYVIPDRKEKMELLHPHNNESRSKRRRSRSQERSKEKSRRSRSGSPQVQKTNLSGEHDHGQLPSSSHRDKPSHHPDVDQSKSSGNGSANHHWRHNGSSSGLGGYSPRKRKTEAAVKTSPIRSPERKSAGWDLPPSGTDVNLSASASSGLELLSQAMPSNMIKLASSNSVASNLGKPLSSIYFQSMPTFKVEPSVDSVQLTQATRPMRRLYIDNIPASASEKDITECFNTFLLSSGSNHIRGTRPCISCMIHREKGQALLEFLTPEDASAALSFDGRSLHGCSVKIRRPKDYVDLASGSAERSKAGVSRNSATNDVAVVQVVKDVAISEVVKDSPNKIFVGGIAEGFSSEMVMTIVSAFGPLKAFHFEINEDLNEPCAFLEYTDHSITLKACAGLNGMKLGGRVLTVTQAVPNSSSEEKTECKPFYGIPEHVRHLLETPTLVLKLSNVLNQETMELLPDTEVEEILEDVRLECSRFGTVASINFVKNSNTLAAISEANVVRDGTIGFPPHGEGQSSDHLHSDVVEDAKNCDEAQVGEGKPLSSVRDFDTVVNAEGEKHGVSVETAGGGVEGEAGAALFPDERIEAGKSVLLNCEAEAGEDSKCAVPGDSTIESTAKTYGSNVDLRESIYKSEVSLIMERGDEGSCYSGNLNQEAATSSNALGSEKPDATENSAKIGKASNIENIFEVGCVLVEFRRTEASCMAAHCLHGRLFGDQVVSVEYVPLEAYLAKFPK